MSWEHNLAGDPYKIHWKAGRNRVRTRVRFKDGSEEVRHWDDNSYRVLREAIMLAEHDRGEDHAGAWQEYREAGWE